MSGNVLEFFIKMTDLTGRTIAKATANVKKFASNVAADLGIVKKTLENGLAPEKFVRTTAVLDRFGLAMDRAGISGQEFADAYDTLEKRLNAFNKTGKDADALVQHFKASMEDLGFSAKQVESGLAMLQQNFVKSGTTGKEAMRDVRSGMRAAHFTVGALNGNVYALGRAFTYVLGSIKKLGLSAAALTGITVAVYAITEIVTKCVHWWQEKKKRMEEIKNLRFEKHLKDIGDAQKEINKELRDYERRLDGEIERKKKLIEQNRKLQEQELELARIQALSGKTGTERDEVNRDFDAQKAELRARAEIAKAQVDLESETDRAAFIANLEAKLQGPKSKIEAQLRDLDKSVADMEKSKRAELDKSKVWEQGPSSVYGPTMTARWKTAAEKERDFEEWQVSDEDYKKVKERRDRLKEQYDDIIADLEEFAHRREKAVEKAKDAGTDAENTAKDFDIEMLREEEGAWHRYYEELERLEAAAARQRERDAEAQAKLEERLRRQRIKDAEDEARRLEQIRDQSSSRLEAAKDYAAKAWGFYLDRDSLAAHDQDVDRNIEARKQYEKDKAQITTGRYADKFSELRHIARRDGMDAVESQLAEWRKKKTISLDTEATMRVALSENEQKEAMRDLQRSAEAAEDARDYLEQIVKELQEVE